MKRFFALLAISVTCLSLLAASADARRFGGGSSIGKQRTIAPQQAQPAPATGPGPRVAAQPGGNRALGPLAGLAIGAGLGALFASVGLSEGTGTLLMAVLGIMLAMFLVSMFRKRPQPATRYAGAGAPYQGSPVGGPMAGGASGPHRRIPPDFPVEAFLRSARTSFIRLQAANDRRDLDDIREYTTPEMFAEISMQIRERDNTAQQTDVLSLTADLLEVAREGDYAIASVRMRGQLRESNMLENFDEVWHVQMNLRDKREVWLLSGIQQIA